MIPRICFAFASQDIASLVCYCSFWLNKRNRKTITTKGAKNYSFFLFNQMRGALCASDHHKSFSYEEKDFSFDFESNWADNNSPTFTKYPAGGSEPASFYKQS